MRYAFIRLNAVTTQDRQEAILSARDAMSRSGCAILDFQMFSNLSICFRIEIAAEDMGELLSHLTATKLRLSDESLKALGAQWQGDLRGTFEITFLHHDRDLKLDVPAFG